jgi:hypothetical protein
VNGDGAGAEQVDPLARTLRGAAVAARQPQATRTQLGLTYPQLRYGTVYDRDPVTRTCTVVVGGGTTEAELEVNPEADSNPIPGVRCMASYVPRPEDRVLLAQNRSGWVVLGHVPNFAFGAVPNHPKVKVISTATQTPAAVNTFENFDFTAAGVTTPFNTDQDGQLNEMFNDAVDEYIHILWPGVYRISYRCGGSGSGHGGLRRMLRVNKNDTTALDSKGIWPNSGDIWDSGACSFEEQLAAGDTLALQIFADTNNSSFGSSAAGRGAMLSAVFAP